MVTLKDKSQAPKEFGRYHVVKCVMFIRAKNIQSYFWVRVRGQVEGEMSQLDHMIILEDDNQWADKLAESIAKVAELKMMFEGNDVRMFTSFEFDKVQAIARQREEAHRAFVAMIHQHASEDVARVWNRIGPPQPYYPYSMGVQIL